MNFKSYTLRTDSGEWLGQVVLTSDGMFSAVTDYGSFAFAWRSFGEDFRQFITSLNTPYFAGKMYLSNADIWTTSRKKAEAFCDRFAEKILPPLRDVLKKELADGIGWE